MFCSWFFWLAAFFSLTGCSEEIQLAPPAAEQTVLKLRFPQMEQLETRVNGDYLPVCPPNANECYVENFLLLFYDWNGRFVTMYSDFYNISIENNYPETTIRLGQPIPSGVSQMVVLCNVNFWLDEYILRDSKLEDLSSLLDQNKLYTDAGGYFWLGGSDNGRKLPMYGLSEIYPNSIIKCNMSFSVAKIEVAVPSSWNMNEYFWTLHNVPQNGIPYVLTDSYPVNPERNPVFPSYLGNVLSDNEYDGVRDVVVLDYYYDPLYSTPPHPEPEESKTYYGYIPEHQNSTKTVLGEPVDAHTFHKDRTCLILEKKYPSSQFYRIDFWGTIEEGGTKQFFDILRNRHYLVRITGEEEIQGYSTREEALNNPGSNLQYELEDITDEHSLINSNGQYAINFKPEFRFLEYYGDETEPEVTVGYVNAMLPSVVSIDDLVVNEISLFDDRVVTLSDNSLKITAEPVPVKVKLGLGSGSASLILKLGNIETYFEFTIKREPGLSSQASKVTFGSGTGMVRWTKNEFPFPLEFAYNSTSHHYEWTVPANSSTVPRWLEGDIISNSDLYKYRIVICQRGADAP